MGCQRQGRVSSYALLKVLTAITPQYLELKQQKQKEVIVMKKTVNRKSYSPSAAGQAIVNPFVQAMQVAANNTVTENGALTNKSTLNYVLDWFGAGGALRQRSDADKIALFSKAFAQDRNLALKILFYFRDVRQGQGERKTFRTIMNWLGQNYPDVARKNLENVGFYGRYDDLYCLVGTSLEKEVFNVFTKQLKSDIVNMKKGESVSLLAKWLKSENTSSKESRAFGRKTREAMELTSKKYRKILSALRKHINVLEVKMCAGDWKAIDFEKVPSKASLNYRKAFGRHDQDRYAAYLKAVEKGEAKMAAGAVYPYEILRSLTKGGCFVQPSAQEILAADLMWKNQPNWLAGNEHNGFVIADVSGSMFASAEGLPALVAISLALYFAERNTGPFKDIWMNFSTHPSFQKFVGNNIWEKHQNMDRNTWSQSTNLQAAFDLILSTALKSKIAQKDMPDILMIVSDMEFNVGSPGNNMTNFEVMKKKYQLAGYTLPQVIWWNVAARNDNFPIRADETGTALVSGCSPSIFKSIVSGKRFDPMQMVYDTVNIERYNRVIV